MLSPRCGQAPLGLRESLGHIVLGKGSRETTMPTKEIEARVEQQAREGCPIIVILFSRLRRSVLFYIGFDPIQM